MESHDLHVHVRGRRWKVSSRSTRICALFLLFGVGVVASYLNFLRIRKPKPKSFYLKTEFLNPTLMSRRAVHDEMISVEEFSLPVGAILPAATSPTERVVLAGDVWLSDGCVKFVSVVTCQHPQLNFSLMEPEITAINHRKGAAGGRKRAIARRPLSRVLHRDGRNWEPVTIGELCLPDLQTAESVDVRLWYGDHHKEYKGVPRIERSAEWSSEFGMAAMYRGDLWAAPSWLDAWSALGIGHFYLFYNGDRQEMEEEDADLLEAVKSDARVTLHIWPYPMRTVITDPQGKYEVAKYGRIGCYLHMAKMMAFNAAFHRYGSRHAYMGFFDFDELVGLPPEVFEIAASLETSPLHELRSAYADPDVFMLQNRWVVLDPPQEDGQMFTLSDFLQRRVLGGPFTTATQPDYTDWAVRTKFFVKSAGVGNHSLQPYMIGNHFACRLRDFNVVGAKRLTGQFSGPCDQPSPRTSSLVRLPPPAHYVMHFLNLKSRHESLLEFDAEQTVAETLANASEITALGDFVRGWTDQGDG